VVFLATPDDVPTTGHPDLLWARISRLVVGIGSRWPVVNAKRAPGSVPVTLTCCGRGSAVWWSESGHS